MSRTSFPIIALALLLAPGCNVVETAVDVPASAVRAVSPEKKRAQGADPNDLQATLVRLSDAFLYRMAEDAGKLHRGDAPPDRGEVLRWKIRLGTELVASTSGPNPVGNLIDLTVFAALMRGSIERHWKPAVYGDSATPLLDGVRLLEKEMDGLIGVVLKPEQKQELIEAIEAWQKEHPPTDELSVSRVLAFTAKTGPDGTRKKDGLFEFLNLDPLAGLDPAMQEVARARAFAERALYVAQRMPTLLRWQTELLAVDAQEGPAVRQMVANAGQIAASADRIAKVTEQLPDRVAKEREAILKALQEQEKQVATVMSAGTTLTASLTETLKTLEAVLKRLGVGEPVPPGKTPAEPVRIQDITATATQLEATSKQMTELVKSADQMLKSADALKLSAQVTPVIQQAQSGGKEVVDYAFGRALWLVAAIFLAALIYRFIAPRLAKRA